MQSLICTKSLGSRKGIFLKKSWNLNEILINIYYQKMFKFKLNQIYNFIISLIDKNHHQHHIII